MSATPIIHADGSSELDAHPTVEVDRDENRWRWRCPNDHTRWSRTNNHIWCRSCSRQEKNGADVDPEHWEIKDASTGELIPFSAVRLV